MATLTNKSSLHCVGLILLFTLHHASSAQSTGILSSLYKKASQENRPLILVLDNSEAANALIGKSRDQDYSPKSVDYSLNSYYEPSSKKQLASDSDRDGQNWLPNLLQNLSQKKSSDSKYRPRNYKAHDHSISRSRSRSRLRSSSRDRRLRLRSQLTKDDIDDRDSQDRHDRDKDLDKIKSFIAKNLKDEREPHEKQRDVAHERALRTSVIKNLLRYSNDLNCEAKDECADECDDNYNGKKKNDCENRCEEKFDCEDEKKEEKDECDFADSCDEGGDQNISTRGEKLVTEKAECNRC